IRQYARRTLCPETLSRIGQNTNNGAASLLTNAACAPIRHKTNQQDQNMNQTEAHTTEEHGAPIKTPRQLITTVVLAFVVAIIIMLLLVNLVISISHMGSGSDALSPEAVASRIKPVAGFALVDANAPKEFKTGQQVFESTWTACHAAGVA